MGVSTDISPVRPAAVAIRPKPGDSCLGTKWQRGPIRHSEEEWEAVFPHIRRMYVVERRKLRYVIDKLEREHDFKVNPQTLRKRFVQWGIHKHARPSSQRSAVARSSEAHAVSGLSLSLAEAVELEFLTAVNSWTVSYLEELGYGEVVGDIVMPQPSSLVYDAENLSFSFRLITSLLQDGEGLLAGLLARKAFYEVETLLLIEGPLFIWNFLEIVWHMLINTEKQLALMLFKHLTNLAEEQYHSRHPLLTLLRTLHRLLAFDKTESGQKNNIEVIRHGWTLNANMLFAPPDPRLLMLYYRVVWDSALVQMPESSLRMANQLYAAIENKVPAGLPMAMELERYMGRLDGGERKDAATTEGNAYETLCQLPRHYEGLVAQTVAEIRDLCAREPDGTAHKFRALSGLVKSRMWEDQGSASRAVKAPSEQRLHARTLAFVMRVVMEAADRRGCDPNASISSLRNIIALREYGQSPTAPQVIFELRQLEKLLSSSGQRLEAARVRDDSFRRMRNYVGDVPLHST